MSENNQSKSKGRGGARKGAGRKTGSATRKTREIANKAADEGVTPLEYLLGVMRDIVKEPRDRMAAAIAAAPYVHAKLASVELKGGLRLTKTDLSDDDLAAIATASGR